jgi:hypothetical protein
LVADQWASSVSLMQAQLASRSIAFLAVIHPNQWFRPTPYTGRPRPPQADALAEGYPAIRKRVPALRERVNVLDLTALFDDRDDVFSDDCCHFTTEGGQAILREVARWLTSLPEHQGEHP